MGTQMTKRQRQISYTLNFYVTSILMYMITQNVVANIMVSYPDVADYAVKSLTTLPTLFGLIATFAMGAVALKFDKTKLLVLVMCSMGIFSLIFFVWVLIWMFHALRVSCNLKGYRLGILYAIAIIGGDLICRVLINLCYNS